MQEFTCTGHRAGPDPSLQQGPQGVRGSLLVPPVILLLNESHITSLGLTFLT